MKTKKITREKIVETAVELFSQSGMDAVSMDDIAKKLGVTKPVIYYYFKDKDEMVKYAFNLKKKEIESIFNDLKTFGELSEFIRAIIDKHYMFFSKNALHVNCFFKMIDFGKRDYLRKMAEDVREKNKTKIKAAVENLYLKGKKIGSDTAEVISIFISSLISYLIFEIKMSGKVDMKSIYRLIDVFIKGLGVFFIIMFFSFNFWAMDLNVDEAVEIAFKKNISVLNAYTSERIYKEKINEYYGSAWPQISVSANYTKNIEKPLAFFGGRKTEVGMENVYTMGLNLNQVVWAGGKVDTAIKMARIYSNISVENTKQIKNIIKKSVKQIFYSILYAKELLKLQTDILNISKEHLLTVEEKYKQGLQSDLNVLRQKVEVSNNEPALIKAENLYKTGVLNLKNLLGFELDEEINIVGKLDYNYKKYSFEELYKTALLNRPDYKLSLLNKDMAEKQLKIEKAGHWPTISLFASKQFSGQSETSKFPDENTRGWSSAIGLSFNMPIFNGFSTVSKIKQAEYNLELAERNIEDIKRKIKIEIMESLFAIEEAEKRIESQKVSVENAEKVLKATEERFKNGLASQLEINDATVAYNAARLGYLTAVYDYIISVINLDYTIGL
ncbi:MAG: TolC family protein [Elusimicrobiota bacterium]